MYYLFALRSDLIYRETLKALLFQRNNTLTVISTRTLNKFHDVFTGPMLPTHYEIWDLPIEL